MGSFLIVAALDSGLAVWLILRLLTRIERYAPTLQKNERRREDLPSVSICIAARNERHAMTQCLERVLESDYEKLEVIVFDDSSDDDTSILIRSFAHAGVRFVPATALPDGWLGRTHALDILAREASGTYIVYMDVDTFISPKTISTTVEMITRTDKAMLSVLPSRNDIWRASTLFGPLRYFWQLVVSSYAHPTASAAFWMVNRERLLDIGGLARVKGEVLAETRLAAIFGRDSQYVIDSGKLGISYEKKWRSQIETSRRTLYPLVRGKRSIMAALGLLLLNIPLFGAIASLALGWQLLALMFGALLAAFMLIYGMYTYRVWRSNWWIGAFLWPIVIFQEGILFIQSVTGYLFHTITWKGRPVAAAPTKIDFIELNK